MTNAIIIHGTGGSPEGNWFPWLKEKLESIGIETYVTRFPIDEQQSLSSWMKEFENYRQYLNKDTILIGHSLGPGFIFNVLEDIDFTIKAAFLVSPFIGKIDIEYFDNCNKTFIIDKTFDFSKIKNNCQKFYIYRSDNDPYVPIEKADFLVEALNAKFKLIKGGGHLNAEFGYSKFEELFEDIKRENY